MIIVQQLEAQHAQVVVLDGAAEQTALQMLSIKTAQVSAEALINAMNAELQVIVCLMCA